MGLVVDMEMNATVRSLQKTVVMSQYQRIQKKDYESVAKYMIRTLDMLGRIETMSQQNIFMGFKMLDCCALIAVDLALQEEALRCHRRFVDMNPSDKEYTNVCESVKKFQALIDARTSEYKAMKNATIVV